MEKAKKVFILNISLIIAVVLALGGLVASIVVSVNKAREGNPMASQQYLDEYTYTNTQIGANSFVGNGDPFVFFDDESSLYYLTATLDGAAFKIQSSPDLIKWSAPKTIFTPSLVSWGKYDPSIGAYGLWGPEIHKRNGKYFLYYSCWAKDIDTEAPIRIGVATSNTIDGMYVDKGSPLFDFGFCTIDNNLFTDTDGQSYMYFSRDCSENITDSVNNIKESQIYCVKMNNDFISTDSFDNAKMLIRPDQPWELKSGATRWNEGCWMQKMPNNKYYLFYSANYHSSNFYSIGYAVSDSPMGTFVKNPEPLMKTFADNLVSPGNNSFFWSKDKKELFTAYHMLSSADTNKAYRFVCIDRIGLRSDGTFYANAPTMVSQPIPSGSKSGHSLLSCDATVTVSSTQEGYNAKCINDGEVSTIYDNEDRQWVSKKVSASELNKEYVLLDFAKPVKINSIYIYNSLTAGLKSNKVNIEFSDGTILKEVKLADFQGGAGIVNLDKKKTTSIKITIADKGFAQKAFALTEVMVFGE